MPAALVLMKQHNSVVHRICVIKEVCMTSDRIAHLLAPAQAVATAAADTCDHEQQQLQHSH
jgi:uncharacterized membrane protein